MLYELTVNVRFQKQVEVEAETEEEAIKLAEKMVVEE